MKLKILYHLDLLFLKTHNKSMLEEWRRKLREASQGRAVLVEGKRDRWALQRFGIKNVFTLEGKRLSDLPDLLEDFREVVLLFDLDKHGERINTKVKEILEKQGYILIEDFREELRNKGIIYVEDLHGEVGGPDCSTGAGQAYKA
ncbi:MAG: toprim domain-containing protein [Aquificaceae bacterium]|uniref:toprim domain-containing protein n=1 Tax=Hydrogenobacter sp. Uz 6-8 TaxID=3384828 RepID=UPI0030A1D493